jgi:hypothetical protein
MLLGAARGEGEFDKAFAVDSFHLQGGSSGDGSVRLPLEFQVVLSLDRQQPELKVDLTGRGPCRSD